MSVAKDDHADRKHLEKSCLHFWMAMLDHQLPRSEYESGIISGLAVLGVSQDKNGGWLPAHECTQTLLAMVTVARALVVHRAKTTREEMIR